MADVRLDFYDLDADALPDLCMRCGAPAVVRPMKRFSWLPSWARLMPPIIGVWFIKRRLAPIPLCEQHRNHWTIRYLYGFGGLAVFLFCCIVGGILFGTNVDDDPHGPLTILGGAMLVLGGVLFLAWIVTMIVLGVTQINVLEISDDSIVLKNISPEFVRAYREQTRGVPGVDDLARDQWARPAPGRGGDYDDPRRVARPDMPDLPPDDQYRRG